MAAAPEIVHQAVERYKELCEGKRRGEFVQRQQRIRGVECISPRRDRRRRRLPRSAADARPSNITSGAGGAGAPALFGAPFGAPAMAHIGHMGAIPPGMGGGYHMGGAGAWTRRDWRCSPRAAGLFRRRRDRRRADRPSRATTPRARVVQPPGGDGPGGCRRRGGRGGRGGRGAAAATIGAARARPYAGGVRAADAHAAARRTTTVRGESETGTDRDRTVPLPRDRRSPRRRRRRDGRRRDADARRRSTTRVFFFFAFFASSGAATIVFRERAARVRTRRHRRARPSPPHSNSMATSTTTLFVCFYGLCFVSTLRSWGACARRHARARRRRRESAA